ncbi:MAG: ribosome biogenesis GTP-binding protein YihA/YsxC [Acidobacteriota bacterium]|nr:ribosome biogenesis GTP-binding protein YihA/YsxC [Acidobacteriota bacterium]
MKVNSAEFVRSAPSDRELLRDDRPQVAFVGRSNVGKSSLLNRLLGRKGLARTSSTPGRTRMVNYFLVNDRFYFVDLPGYGYAKAGMKDRQAWAVLVDDYCRDAFPGALVVLLVDAKVGATTLDQEAWRYLRGYDADIVVAATKTDRLSRNRRQASMNGIRRALQAGEEIPVIPVSARSGDGMKELWGVIDTHLRSQKERTA